MIIDKLVARRVRERLATEIYYHSQKSDIEMIMRRSKQESQPISLASLLAI